MEDGQQPRNFMQIPQPGMNSRNPARGGSGATDDDILEDPKWERVYVAFRGRKPPSIDLGQASNMDPNALQAQEAKNRMVQKDFAEALKIFLKSNL